MASPLFPQPDARAPDDRPTAGPPPFRVDVEPDHDAVRVCPVGELDLATVEEVHARIEELRAAGFRQVVLDLRELTFLDSTGVRLVLHADASSRDDGWEFSLIEGRAGVQRVFELAGVRARLRFVDSSAAADGHTPGSKWR